MANYTNNLIKTLYYLLYSKYGNSSIASSDPEQFKYKVFATIFEYAPAWKKRLEIQEKLFNIDLSAVDPEYLKGTMVMYNHAANPDTEPTTSSYDALPGINRQTVQTTKRGMLEGYETLLDLVNTDVTAAFLNKFKKLFITVVMPQAPLWYKSIGYLDDSEPDRVQNPNSSVYGNYRTNTFQEIWEKFEDFEADYRDCGIPTTI
jgi:hypothetical protein